MIDSKFEKYQEYMREHQIAELFEDLCTAVAYKQPEEVKEFLIGQLELRQSRDKITLPIFTEKEIENIFYLYNLKRETSIPKFKAMECLKSIAHSKYDFDRIEKDQLVPERVDLEAFKKLSQQILGISFDDK